MGVYNPKKKMPTSCYMCWDSLYCEYKIKNLVKMAQGRADDCPLIEIDETEWEWCHDCKEYDQEAHCCHRWTKVIRKTVEDVKVNYTIVTCGECKYHDEDGWGYGNCSRPFVDHLRTAEYDFCSYGERREDENYESKYI